MFTNRGPVLQLCLQRVPLTGLGIDKLRGQEKEQASKRAVALRNGLERLGPAYVKIAQAVSTRVDLLPPEYLIEIERLQDRVPPFPNVVVRATSVSFPRANLRLFLGMTSVEICSVLIILNDNGGSKSNHTPTYCL